MEKKNKHIHKEDKCNCGCEEHSKECNCKEEPCTCGCEEHSCNCDEKECCCNESSELELARKDAQQNLELAQRLAAEFDNYRKRNAEIVRQSEENGIIKVVTKVLPCLDAFDNAFKMISDEGSLKGLKLIYDQLTNMLASLNISEIEAEGCDFDPNLHNAVLAEEAEGKENKVLEVFQKGYKLNDRVIRYAMVKVGK